MKALLGITLLLAMLSCAEKIDHKWEVRKTEVSSGELRYFIVLKNGMMQHHLSVLPFENKYIDMVEMDETEQKIIREIMLTEISIDTKKADLEKLKKKLDEVKKEGKRK